MDTIRAMAIITKPIEYGYGITRHERRIGMIKILDLWSISTFT